jgi:hypothetical protein
MRRHREMRALSAADAVRRCRVQRHHSHRSPMRRAGGLPGRSDLELRGLSLQWKRERVPRRVRERGRLRAQRLLLGPHVRTEESGRRDLQRGERVLERFLRGLGVLRQQVRWSVPGVRSVREGVRCRKRQMRLCQSRPRSARQLHRRRRAQLRSRRHLRRHRRLCSLFERLAVRRYQLCQQRGDRLHLRRRRNLPGGHLGELRRLPVRPGCVPRRLHATHCGRRLCAGRVLPGQPVPAEESRRGALQRRRRMHERILHGRRVL